MNKVAKIIISLFVVFTMSLSNVQVTFGLTSNEEISIIKGRLKEHFLSLDTIDDGSKVETCYVSKAVDYLKLIKEDGSFDDVNYKANNNAANGAAWSPYLALDRLQAISISYSKEGNALYKKQEVVNKLEKAIKYWAEQNPRSTNWWENQVGVQLRFSRMALFLEDVVDEDTENIMLKKLLEKVPVKYGTGQNNLWFDQNYLYYYLLTEDSEHLHDMINNYLSYCLVTQKDDKTSEAVQVDNSFYMHGKQFYSNGYGMSMFRDMSFWIYMLRDTSFSLGKDVINRMADYMINGTSWTIRGDIQELYLGYREYKYSVGYKNYAAEYIEPLKRMIASDKTHAKEYQDILNNIENPQITNGKNGNYYMWRSGYASHMRNDYGVNIKMDSNEIIGGEWRGSWPNGNKGQLIYWTSSASSTISVDGDEYTAVYPTYDWAHCPGTTTAARLVQDYSNSGRFTNGTSHTIGVSNGQYGACAYAMDKKGTQVKKGYFFFDDEIVALGSGITSSESVEIHTTLNQAKADNVLVDGDVISQDTTKNIKNSKWIYNNKVGYVFPDETSVTVSNAYQKDNPSLWAEEKKVSTPRTFKAYINHGIKPSNQSYSYIILPNKTSKKVSEYADNNPITIVANNENIQAVRNENLKQTQINFYEAGTLEYKTGYKVTVDQPCSLIIDESENQRKITLATSENQSNTTIQVKLDYGQTTTKTDFITPSAPYTGSSMTLNENDSNLYNASSSLSPHDVKSAFDNDMSTYWQSKFNDEEWISFYAGNSYISELNIKWGDHYASDFDIYTSKDGKTYTYLKSVNQNVNDYTVSIGGIYPYLKIVMKKSKGSNYQIKEIGCKSQDALTYKKPVEVSSQYNDELKKENAVDGNTNARWGSKRDSNDNWIIVDLQKNCSIKALNILWEAACSDEYSIEISLDKKNWTTIKDKLKSNQSLYDQYLFDDNVYGRYLKIHSTKTRIVNGKNYGISIYELVAYGNEEQEDTNYSNIALNKSVETSSQYNDELKKENAVDGNIKTRWGSIRNSDDNWIIIDLEQYSKINKIQIDWENACSDDYTIEVSADKKTWQVVTETKTNASLSDIHTYDSYIYGRYLKIHSYKTRRVNNKNYGIGINEVAVYGDKSSGVNENQNIALNKPSYSSSIYKSQYGSEKAFDGSVDKTSGKESRWVSLRRKDNSGKSVDYQWIYVDLQNYYDISKIVLNWEAACAKSYKIQISSNGKNWKDITSVSDGKGGKREFDYTDQTVARYVRVECLEPSTVYGYSLWEFEVYGNRVKQPKTTNLALNKKSSASSSYKAQYDSSKAFDGSEDATSGKESRWVSLRQKDNKEDVSNQWISVDLGDYYNVNQIKLNWEGTGAEEYKLQVSLDGETWTDITHAQHSNGGIETYNYNGVTARYVKMQGIKPNSIYGYSLWEFEVYGDSLDKCELTNLYYMNVNMDTSIYTPETKERFNQALNNTYKVINENVDSSTILETKQELLDSINNLKLLANFDYLGSLIKECKNLDESVYAPATFEKLKDKLQEAEIVYNDKNSSQEKIDSICEELVEAKDKLIFKSDKTDLIALVDEVNKLDRSLYIDACVEELDIYLNKAQEVINDENANEESVLEAYKNLSDAKDLLVTKESYEHLQELITKALDIDESKYTEESIKLLTDKRKQAEEAYKESVPQNDKVQKAILELEGVLNALEKKIDYSQVIAIIDKAESIDQTKYTPSSLLRVNNEVLKAKALIDKADVTQEEIDEMVNTLSEAIDHLVLKADKTKLEELVSKIDALDMSKYENTDSLITVLNQSKEVLMNEEATQSEVDQACEMLNASYKQLKLKSDNIEITEIPTQSTNKTNKNEQIKTGDSTYINMTGWSLLIMMSCLGIFFIRKRVY